MSLSVAIQLRRSAAFALALPVQVWAGARFYVGAWKVGRHGSTDMNSLVALGTSAAFLYSVVVTFFPGLFAGTEFGAIVYYDTSTAIIGLVLLGRLLEARATTDPARRKAIYGDMQWLVHQKGAVGIPVFISLLDGYDRRLKGLQSIPLGGLMAYNFGEYVWWDA